MAENSSKNGGSFVGLKETTSSIQPQQESVLQFHNWRFCEECFPSPNTYQFYSDDYVFMDDSNFYGNTANPGGYNTPAIAAASTALYNGWGSPSIGEVVNIHTAAFNVGNSLIPARDYCMQYLGTTSTQQNASSHWGVNHQAQHTGTFSDCADCCEIPEPGPCDFGREVVFWLWNDLHLWLDPSQPATGTNYVNIGNLNHNPPGDLYLQMVAAGFNNISSDSTIAKYGNKIWVKAWNADVSPSEFCIIEFEINTSTLSASFTQIYFSSIPTTDLTQLFGAGAAAKNANTLITAGTHLAQINLISSGDPAIPGSFDIGGPFATHTTNLSTDPNFVEGCSGDLVYIQNTNSVIITTHRFPATGGSNTHHISNYQLTAAPPYSPGGSSPFSLTSKISVLEINVALFCYDNNIYGRFGNALPGSQSGNYQINIDSNGSITRDYQPAIFSSLPGIPNASDAASDPRSCFECVEIEEPPKFCYEIGDITDPADGGAGGMVFLTPFTGPNQTPYYYEVALDDLSTGNHPLEHNVNHVADPNIQAEANCGTIPSNIPQHTFNCPWDNPIDINIPNNMCRWGYGPGAFQSSVTTPPGINTPTGVSIGDPVSALGWQQNQLFPPGTVIDEIVLVPPSSASTNITIGGNTVLCAGLPYNSYLFLFSNSMIPTVPAFSQPIKILTTGGISTVAGPFSVTGAEWGAYGDPLQFLPSTFGIGDTNTQQIVTYPATPVWGSHDIAAELCVNHQVFAPGERWFLPSLDEFDVMFNNVGPNTSHGATLNLSGQLEDMSDTYWTSSDLMDMGPVGAGFYYAWAYNVSLPPYTLTSVPPNPTGPVMAQRCSALSVRPIRKFKCTPPEPLPPDTFMWCDAFVKARGINSQAPTYFQEKWVNYYSPGACGSGYGYFDSDDFGGNINNTATGDTFEYTLSNTYRAESTIGADQFDWQVMTTDAGGNQWDLSDFDDANNPDGYTIKLWEADGTYLGTWHYQNVIEVHRNDNWVRNAALSNNLSWYDPIPRLDTPSQMTSQNFPDKIYVKFSGVTHIDGPNQIVNYGFSKQRNPLYGGGTIGSDWWRIQNWNPGSLSWTNFSTSNITGTEEFINALSSFYTVHHTNYFNEYYEETWGGWTCSFAYIQLKCDTAIAKWNASGNAANVVAGSNNVFQQKHVVCLKQVFDDLRPIHSYVTDYSGGHIGVGGHSPHSGWPLANYPTHQMGPDLLLNTTYGNVTVNGAQGTTPNPQPLDNWMPGFGPWTAFQLGVPPQLSGGLPNYPKHYLFAWFGDYIPSPSSSLTHFNSLTDGLNAMNDDGVCEAHPPCDYQVGDTGPAGGIIVAVPYMNVNTSGDPLTEIVGPSVPPLQGNVWVKNTTNYYYELSPTNLNNTDCGANSNMVSFWGFWSKDGIPHSCDIATNPVTADAWIPNLTLYDIPAAYGGGSLVTGPVTGQAQVMEYVGQGHNINDAYKLANYPTTPWYDPSFGGSFQAYACGWPNISNNVGAFKLCWDYNLNGYYDWFLPTVGEMDFARNYTPPGTLYDSSSGGNYTQQQYNNLDYDGDGIVDYTGSVHYWTCNTYKQDGSEAIIYEENWNTGGYQGGNVYVDSNSHFGQYINYPTNTLDSFDDWHAYSVSMDPMMYSSPSATPDDQYWKTISGRLDNLNVRAMRRFQCTTEYTPADSPNFIEYNFRYHAVANPGIGSFIHPWPRTPGRIHGLSSSATPNPTYYANPYFVDANAPSFKLNHIGDNHIQFFQFKKDAVNNNAMWTVGTVLKFEVHSQLEEHLGTWEYEVMHAQMCMASSCSATFVCQLVQQTVVVNGATQVDLWPSSTNVNAITGTNHLAYLKVFSATYPTNFASTFNITNYLGLGINNQFLSAPVNNDWRVVNDYCNMGDCQEWLAEFSPPASYPLYPDLSSCTDPIEFYDERRGINNPLNKELDECANPENWGLKSLLNEKNDFEKEEEVREEIREEVKEEKTKKQELEALAEKRRIKNKEEELKNKKY